MGFADYLRRNPSGAPSPINEDDEKFVINLIEEMKHKAEIHLVQKNQLVIQTNQRA